MANIVTVPLPHDLPENWTDNQYVSPGGVEVGLTEKHGYNYLMKQVNNAQMALLELDSNTVPYSLILDVKDMSVVSEFSPIVLGWFNSMKVNHIANFLLRIYVEGSPLEGGEWRLAITKTSDTIGTIVATKHQADMNVGGIMIKTCSIYGGTFTTWRPIFHDGVVPATME